MSSCVKRYLVSAYYLTAYARSRIIAVILAIRALRVLTTRLSAAHYLAVFGLTIAAFAISGLLCGPHLVAASGKDVLTPEKVLAESSSRPPLPSVRWLPNSKQLILSLTERGIGPEAKHWIELVDLDSGKRSRVAEGENPQPSPDGLKIAYTRSEKGSTQLWIISVKGENPKPLTKAPGGLAEASFTWSPDSRKIAYAVAYAVRITPTRRRIGPTDGKSSSVVVTGGEPEIPSGSEIWVTDLETESSRKLTSGLGDIRSLAWFPDGKALLCRLTVWWIENPAESFGEVRSISVETGEFRTLVKRPGAGTGQQSMYPALSPDGKEVAFRYVPATIRYAEYFRIGMVSAQGGVIRELASDTYVAHDSSPLWSPDGRRIYFTCRDGVFTQVCAVASDTQARWLTRSLRNASGLAVSPDGRYLAWTAQDAQGRLEIRVAHSDGSNERVFLDLAPEVNTLALGEVREVRWRSSDGLQIAGLLIKPIGYEAGKKYPLLVDLHGGPRGGVSLGQGSILQARYPLEWHLWATKGFVVFVPDYRSSGIYDPDHISKARERQDRHERDFDDIMAGVDHVIRMGLADETKLALIGHSWGATLTNWIITHTHRFKVAVSYEGTAEEYINWGIAARGPAADPNSEWLHKGTPWEVPQNYRKGSALEYVKGVTTPTLFVSGENGFPLYHNQFLYTAWRRQGVEAQLLVYKGEGHVIERPENQRDLLMRVLGWVDSHLR